MLHKAVKPAACVVGLLTTAVICAAHAPREQVMNRAGPTAAPAHTSGAGLVKTQDEPTPRRHQAVEVGGFNPAHRHTLPTGSWGCPGPLKIHPLAKVPTLVYWQQSNFNDPQPGDGLKWAIYVGRPGAPWVTYAIPVFDPDGSPITRLERPRISFTYDPDGYPAIAVGLDDGGIRYFENEDLGDAIHVGSIALVRPVREAAGLWSTEIVPFDVVDLNYHARLDFPHLAFTPAGDPLVSAIAYHATLDDYDAEKPYEDLLLARKSASQWRVQKVLHSICPCFCFDCPGGNSPGRDIGSTEQSQGPCLVLGGVSGGSIGGSLTECPFSLNPYARFIAAYPSLSIRENNSGEPDDDVARLAFTFGERVSSGVLQFRNFVYSIDFGIADDDMAGEGPLPVVGKKKMQAKTTTDYLDDFAYSGHSGNGTFVASFGDTTNPLYKDEYQLRKNVASFWTLLAKSRIPTIQEYDRRAFRFWLPETVQQLAGGNQFGYLTPFATSLAIQEWDLKTLATSVSYFGSSLSGCTSPYYCSQTVVDNDGVELAYEPSLVLGAFPPSAGMQSKAIVAMHVDDQIIVSPQDQPLAISAGFGDFNFDLLISGCEDTCAFEAAYSDQAWSVNPMCDGDGDGDVDEVDEALFGTAPECCG